MSAPVEKLETPALAPDGIRSRYTATLGAQTLKLLLSVVAAAIVPRALGASAYGNYSFLLSTASTLRGFLDPSAQQAFFTFSSQERGNGALTKLYAWVLAAQLAIVMLLIAVAAAAGKISWLWPGQQLDQIVLLTLLDWALFLAISLQQLGDSKGLTVYPQIIGAAVSVLTILGLLGLWTAGLLDFHSYAWLNLSSAAASSIALGYWLLAKNRDLCWSGVVDRRHYVRRWWIYAKPLILVEYYLPLVSYLGLYLIQRWYGSVEQGYYALAAQWSALAMVFTTAAVSIFWRELAHQTAAQNLELAARTYEQFGRLLFFLVLVLSCWLSMSSELLVRVVAGDQYLAATRVLAIMAFYPVAQTLGQLTVAALKATERTASYGRWSVLLSIPDLILIYVLLAPADGPLPGMHLGAMGMALKMALYGLIIVQVFDWLNSRFLGISYRHALRRKLTVFAAVAATALVVLSGGSAMLQGVGFGDAASLVISSMAYAAAIVALVWFRPGLAGLSPEQIYQGVQFLLRR